MAEEDADGRVLRSYINSQGAAASMRETSRLLVPNCLHPFHTYIPIGPHFYFPAYVLLMLASILGIKNAHSADLNSLPATVMASAFGNKIIA